MKEFYKGAIGFGLIYASPENNRDEWQGTINRKDIENFLSLWENTAIDNRIFLSFTSEDYPTAETIAKAYERLNYTVFLYIRGQSNPLFPPDLVGHFFRLACHRLVVDSINARQSVGIHFEYIINEYETKYGKNLIKNMERVGDPFDDLPPLVDEKENERKKKPPSELERLEEYQIELEVDRIISSMKLNGNYDSSVPREVYREKAKMKLRDLYIHRAKIRLRYRK